MITFIYLMMSSGIAMDVHYCMGKKAGVDFYKATNEKCGKCGMKDKPGCCHDEYKFYKLGNDHKNVVQTFLSAPLFESIGLPASDHTIFLPASLIISTPANAPPDISQPDLCIRNCVFRI